MNKLILHIIVVLFVTIIYSCDCLQHVQGIVLDSSTKLPLDSVKISRYIKNDTLTKQKRFIYTDTNGRFDFTAMSGSLIGCPKVLLSFEKKGYEKLIKKYKSCCTDNDTIVLKKKLK